MRDILWAAIGAEKDELLRTLDGLSEGQSTALLEEIAACDSLLGRLGPPRVVLYQIRDETLRTKPLVKRKAGRHTGQLAKAGARVLHRGL